MKQIYKKNKRVFYLMVISIFTILTMVISVTYAYFKAQGNSSSKADVDIITGTTDNLIFQTGDDISIYANQTNFNKNKSSLSSSTTASATLKARNDKSSTYYYDITLSINSNEFTYTQDEDTPELLVKVNGPDGEITENNGLSYKTITDVSGETISGFDITNLNTAVKLVYNDAITAEAGKTVKEEYTVTVYFVNLDADQTNNMGKTFDANLVIEKNYASSCNDNTLACTISKLSLTDTTSLAADDPTGNVRYIGGDNVTCTYDGNEVELVVDGVTLETLKEECSNIWKNNSDVNSKYFSKSFDDYYYNEPENVIWNSESNKCTTSSGGTVYYWGVSTITEDLCTGKAYQYNDDDAWVLNIEPVGAGIVSGYSVQNFVSFNDELWRIIGVFDVDDGNGNVEKRVKIIKNDKLKDISWDYKQPGVGSSTSINGSNDWTDSQLMMYLNSSVGYTLKTGYTKTGGVVSDGTNIIYEDYKLPVSTATGVTSYEGSTGTFKLTSEAQSMIDDAVWYLGGIFRESDDYRPSLVALNTYLMERGKNVYTGRPTSWTGKVALLYPSDYVFATIGGDTLSRKSCLNMNVKEWYDEENLKWTECANGDWLASSSVSITPASNYSNILIGVSSRLYTTWGISPQDARPVVYLKSSVSISSGDGTYANPYQLSIQ